MGELTMSKNMMDHCTEGDEESEMEMEKEEEKLQK